MSSSFFPSSNSPDTVRLLERVAGLRGATCAGCGRSICGHELVFSVALGCQTMPRCVVCLGLAMGQSPQALRDQLFDHLRHRDCYHTAWQAESRHEFGTPVERPRCLWPGGENAGRSDRYEPPEANSTPPSTAPPQPGATRLSASSPEIERPAADAHWDAGELGCGDLVLQLRGRLREMPPGSLLELVARDPGAPSDLPAWCGLTGHTLVHQEPPRYWIRRREN